MNLTPKDLDVRLQQIIGGCVVFPHPQSYHVGKVYAAYDEEPDIPLEIIGEPVGYLWLYINLDHSGKKQITFEQSYIKPEYRKYPQILEQFEAILYHWGKRARTQRCVAETRLRKVQEFYLHRDFKISMVRLEAEGTVDDVLLAPSSKYMQTRGERIKNLTRKVNEKWAVEAKDQQPNNPMLQR